MNYKLTNGVMFVLGAAIGSVVTWKLVKTKYEQIAQEEIDSVKETLYGKNGVSENEESADDAEMQHYSSIINEQGYTNYSNNEKKEEKKAVDRPYVITPDEYGELDGYDAITLTYYADGVLTDDNDEIVDDIDDIVGLESLEHFGEYEEDSVFVRDDSVKCDYEILKDYDNYHDKFPMED